MARVVFMCGPAGSGKSTVARKLETEGFVRLSFNQEAWGRGLREMPLPASDHAVIEELLLRRLVELVTKGRDAVLVFSFWSRQMRSDWRALAELLGTVPETIYLPTDQQICLDRIEAHGLRHGDDFIFAPVVAAAYFDGFRYRPKTRAPRK